MKAVIECEKICAFSRSTIRWSLTRSSLGRMVFSRVVRNNNDYYLIWWTTLTLLMASAWTFTFVPRLFGTSPTSRTLPSRLVMTSLRLKDLSMLMMPKPTTGTTLIPRRARDYWRIPSHPKASNSLQTPIQDWLELQVWSRKAHDCLTLQGIRSRRF